MTIGQIVLLWLATLVIWVALDAAWHALLFKWEYRSLLQPLMREAGGKKTFLAIPFVLLHLIRVSALVSLILLGVKEYSLAVGAVVGAIAGALGISLGSLANYAWLREWRVELLILETAWGPILGGFGGVLVIWLKHFLLS